MNATHDNRAGRRPSRWRWLRLLLAVVILAPVFAAQMPVPSVKGDSLSDAQAQQQKLQKLIADQKKQMAQLTAMQGDLQGQINQTKSSLQSVSQNLNALEGQIGKLRGRINDVKAKYNDTVNQLAGLQAQLQSIEAQEQAKSVELAHRRQVLGDHLIAAYQSDQTSLLEQLLQSHSITDAMSDVSYLMDMGAADKALAEQIQQDQRTLAEIHTTVTQTRDATVQLRDQIAAQKKALDADMAQLNASEKRLATLKQQIAQQLAQQKAAEAKLASNKVALKAQLDSNAATQAQLAKKIDQLLAEQARRGGIPSQYSGTLIWPMGGYESQPFGCTGFSWEPPLGNCAHFHTGIDLVAPCGTPIHAAGSGEILFVGYEGDGAWIVVIAHSSSLATLYAHGQPVRPPGIYTGAYVTKGQTIMYEGTTGNSTGCHLHWGTRLNGTYVNPLRFI